MSDYDLALALQLQEEAVGLGESNVSNDELNPDLHSLFLAFDQMYFEGRLASVEVRWSNKMT